MVHWIVVFVIFVFSSRRRHTRSKRDWSSDVCSSDLVFCLKSRARLLGTPCRQRVLRDRFPSNPACESCRLRTVVYSPTTRENAHEDHPLVMSDAHISRQKYREAFQSSTGFQIPSGLADGCTQRAH